MASEELERTRLLHEEIERLERQAVEALLEETRTHREALANEHQVKKIMAAITQRQAQLEELYADVDGGESAFTLFTERIEAVRAYYSHYENDIVQEESEVMTTRVSVDDVKAMFTGEEFSGRQLDLHANFLEYQQLRQMEQMPYIVWLENFWYFEDIPKAHKKGPYAAYVQHLYETLSDFCSRARPLYNREEMEMGVRADFETAWAAGDVSSWVLLCAAASLDARRSWQDSGDGGGGGGGGEAMVTDEADDPLFCKPCNRRYAKDTVFRAHLGGKKHRRAVERSRSAEAAARAAETRAREEERRKQLAQLELLVAKYCAVLSDQLYDTRDGIRQKQGKTFEEIEAEIERDEQEEEVAAAAAAAAEASDEEEELKPIYNPKRLPTEYEGGPPIPYWLYKVRGLNITHKCEICGNQTYRGHADYERHFQEHRHTTGMRILGIPNTRAFMGVTLIEDAQLLWKAIQQRAEGKDFNPELEEEMEDECVVCWGQRRATHARRDGAVYSRRLFSLLRRQGLL